MINIVPVIRAKTRVDSIADNSPTGGAFLIPFIALNR